jgi:nifR3 family TIM-barrel protein
MFNKSPAFHVAKIPIYGRALLSPMDGYSDLPFRSLCRGLGSAMSYTEFVKVEDILERLDYVEEKLAFREAERPVVIQIYGDDPGKILDGALRAQERGPDVIDLNMGCPAKTIAARGAGVGLMRTPEKIAEIFGLLTAELDVPVTGKIRLGWDDETRNYLEVARIVEDGGGQALAVHGRTKSQGYGGEADWDAIAEIADALSIPVIGNGDVNRAEDIDRMLDHTGCAAVMIGRAAMSNPWIFLNLDREHVPIELVRRSLLEHLDLNLDFYGPERGLVLFRKFAARYLAPFKLPREVRQKLLTLAEADEFVAFLDEVVMDGEGVGMM